MKVEYQKIYRVMCCDMQRNTPETYWCNDKKACQEYIEKSGYKHLLNIEESTLLGVPLKCV